MFWLWLWLWFQNFDSFTCGTPGSEKKPSAGDQRGVKITIIVGFLWLNIPNQTPIEIEIEFKIAKNSIIREIMVGAAEDSGDS